MSVFGIIPARSGSKRIPDKNIREVDGRPLIAHTVQQADAASSIDHCIVSTDDTEIADIARENGGTVPFLRPDELATDAASSMDVVEHALDWRESTGKTPEIVALLQVTSPLRTAKDIDRAITRLQSHELATSIVSISEYRAPPYWAIETDEDGLLHPHFDTSGLWESRPERSQDLPSLSHPNGAIFAAEVDAFRAHRTFYTDSTIGYEMPPERSIDIDDPFDLKLVRAIEQYREPDEGSG